MTLSRERPLNAKVMEAVLRNGADRCCYCQKKGATLKVSPTIEGYPTLVAHPECDEPVQKWRAERM